MVCGNEEKRHDGQCGGKATEAARIDNVAGDLIGLVIELFLPPFLFLVRQSVRSRSSTS